MYFTIMEGMKNGFGSGSLHASEQGIESHACSYIH